MAEKKGRKDKWSSYIEPRLSDVKKWSEKGLTERQIADRLGVAYSTFNKYKSEKTELSEALKKGRDDAVDRIENAMFESAIGGKQTLKKAQKVKRIKYENGKKSMEAETMEYYEEEIYIPPNTTAGIYLLKHWGKDRGYTNDPIQLELKKRELELKEKAMEEDNW